MVNLASPSVVRHVCAICTDDILPDAIVSTLNCNHQYHRDCLQPWLDAHHNTCPLDRGRITSKKHKNHPKPFYSFSRSSRTNGNKDSTSLCFYIQTTTVKDHYHFGFL